MKFHLLVTLVAFLSLAAVSNAAEKDVLPVPALSGSGNMNNEFSLSEITSVRHNPWSTGYGVDGTISHYFTRYLGFSADADVLRSDQNAMAAYGFRGGPTARFFRNSRVQPFARALFGYGRLKEVENGPHRPYVNGFSYLAGGGTDVRFLGPLNVRLAADFENDPGNGKSVTNNRLLRFGVGLSYHFGGYGR
jgi:hypothetical protein